MCFSKKYFSTNSDRNIILSQRVGGVCPFLLNGKRFHNENICTVWDQKIIFYWKLFTADGYNCPKTVPADTSSVIQVRVALCVSDDPALCCSLSSTWIGLQRDTLEKTRYVKIPRTREESVACPIRRLTSQSGVETRIFAWIPPSLITVYIYYFFSKSTDSRKRCPKTEQTHRVWRRVCFDVSLHQLCEQNIFFTCDDFFIRIHAITRPGNKSLPRIVLCLLLWRSLCVDGTFVVQNNRRSKKRRPLPSNEKRV